MMKPQLIFKKIDLAQTPPLLEFLPERRHLGLSRQIGLGIPHQHTDAPHPLRFVGEMQRARDLMERLLRIASPLGLYAEEFDPEIGSHLGNFPQAFSHLALIEAAARIIILELAHF
jgi:hypothetical protein